MKYNTFGRTVTAILAYLAVFVFLVAIQFPAAGPISEAVKGVTFKGLPSADGKGIRSAEVSAAGIRLLFSERAPLTLTDAAGTEYTAVPVAYEATTTGFAIRFDDGSTVRTSSGAEGSVTWSIIPKKASAKAAMRYELVYGASLLAPADDGSLRLSVGEKTYRIGGLASGKPARTFSVSAVKGGMKPIVAAPEAIGAPASPSQFIAQAPMESAAWSREISVWRDKAWSGLSGPAFDPDEAVWSKGAGSAPSFSEEAFIAYMAEALRRGSIEAAVTLVAAVRSKHADAITWESVPLAGRSTTAMVDFENRNLTEVKTAERLVQNRSIDLFYQRGVVPLLFDRAPYSLAQEAMTLARTLDFSRSSAAQATILIESWLDARNYLPDDQNPFARAYELVDKAMTPMIRKVEGSFYLQTGTDGLCDTRLGLQAGKALIRLAESLEKPIYAGIGQSLVTSLLRLAGEDGSLPASVTVTGATLVRSQDTLGAASIYEIVGDSPYYPHAVSFFKTLGPGAWAWTSAPVITQESNPGRTVFSMDWPVGASHYLALYGVKPFTRIQLYGLDYNMDASFENYNASGYFYKRAAGAMYLKMRHKSRTEDIRLFY
jgi:hypothetical protein